MDKTVVSKIVMVVLAMHVTKTTPFLGLFITKITPFFVSTLTGKASSNRPCF